jgi:hypothetical protein
MILRETDGLTLLAITTQYQSRLDISVERKNDFNGYQSFRLGSLGGFVDEQVSPKERGGSRFGSEVQVLLKVVPCVLDVDVGNLGLGENGGIRAGSDDNSVLHQLLDGR